MTSTPTSWGLLKQPYKQEFSRVGLQWLTELRSIRGTGCRFAFSGLRVIFIEEPLAF